CRLQFSLLSSMEDIPPPLSRLKHTQFQIMAGACASLLELCLFLPLDVVKTRLQLQTKLSNPQVSRYKGVFDALVRISREEGLRGLWKGFFPPLLSDIPRRTMKFVIFEQAPQYLLFGAPHPTPLTYALSGALAGLIEGLIQNPFDVIKITQQASREKKLGTVYVVRKIIKEDGLGTRGLFRGITAMLIRNCIFQIMYLGVYASLRDAIPEGIDEIETFLRKLVIASITGPLGCVASIPLDVTKSKIQGPQPVPGKVKYSTVRGTMRTVYKEEGVRGFYKGLTPQIMRSAPGGMILLLGFEYFYKFFVASF
ncbi:hypothetical protein KR222_005242, partial [Zaprionus bogoriensis]